MTGFGRGVTTTKNVQLTVEIRSVNHRFLEINTKFPKEWMEAEVLAKKMLAQLVSRGKLDVHIYMKELQLASSKVMINWPLLHAFCEAKQELARSVVIEEKWTMQEIATLDGILTVEQEQVQQEEILQAIEQAMQQAIDHLLQMRAREGKELKLVMLQYKNQLQEQVAGIRGSASEATVKYKERLLQRLQELASSTTVDERVLMEVAVFAERIDITEELDRLESHFLQLEETLNESVAVGRKLDFLMQEMHREINTIGSKNQSAQGSVAVVQAKAILEKMREQVQNIE